MGEEKNVGGRKKVWGGKNIPPTKNSSHKKFLPQKILPQKILPRKIPPNKSSSHDFFLPQKPLPRKMSSHQSFIPHFLPPTPHFSPPTPCPSAVQSQYSKVCSSLHFKPHFTALQGLLHHEVHSTSLEVLHFTWSIMYWTCTVQT